MRGRNTRASTKVNGRQYAVTVVGTTITFECDRRGHTYKINFGTKPLARRMGEEGCRMMGRWWSRDRGGCIGECPKCTKEAA